MNQILTAKLIEKRKDIEQRLDETLFMLIGFLEDLHNDPAIHRFSKRSVSQEVILQAYDTLLDIKDCYLK